MLVVLTVGRFWPERHLPPGLSLGQSSVWAHTWTLPSFRGLQDGARLGVFESRLALGSLFSLRLAGHGNLDLCCLLNLVLDYSRPLS